MKDNFGHGICSGRFRMRPVVQLAVMASAWLLLTSCSMFSNRVVTVETASASQYWVDLNEDWFTGDEPEWTIPGTGDGGRED